MTKTPRKSKTAANMMAGRGLMERVEIHVAIAFGASVQPLTITTPRVRRTVIIKAGFVKNLDKKSVNVIVIVHQLSSRVYVFLLCTTSSVFSIPCFYCLNNTSTYKFEKKRDYSEI
jgi:hypothetical protein